MRLRGPNRVLLVGGPWAKLAQADVPARFSTCKTDSHPYRLPEAAAKFGSGSGCEGAEGDGLSGSRGEAIADGGGEMSSESDSGLEWEWKSPNEDMEMQASSDDEEDEEEMLRNSDEALRFLDDLLIRVLFETPSGFAIFLYNGYKLYEPNAVKEIWLDFVDPAMTKRLVRCLVSKTFENKAHAISQSTGANEEFATLIRNYLKPGQKLAVGNEDYKSIIEKELHKPCVYDCAVEELMWGLKIQMQSLLTPENSVLTCKDCFAMSTGIYCFLKEHKFDVKRDMKVTSRIVQLAGIIYDCDCSIERRRHTLRSVAECIKKISHLNTQDWALHKIATALKIICCRGEKVDFPEENLQKYDAPQYTMFLEASSLAPYDEVHNACELRSKVDRELSRLIQLVNKVDVEQPHEAAIDQDGLDGKKIYPDIDPAILD
ncbi:unnamed protein product [Urochloa humidicola]